MTTPALSSLRELTGRTGARVAIGPFLVRVRSPLPALRDHLERFYADYRIDESAEGHFDVAIVGAPPPRQWFRPQAIAVMNGVRPYTPLPADLGGALFEWALNWCIGRHAHRWVVVHAAVVERGGRAMMFPAPPESGKSTLCAALSYSGWRLLSDEFALIDPATGLVHPVPRPISLKERSIDVIRDRHPDVVFGPERQDVNGARFVHARASTESVTRASEPAQPGWIILPRWTAGRPTSLTRLPKAQALVKVADQSFNYNYLGPQGYETLVAIVRRADCYALEYSDLDDVLARLTELTLH